MSKCKEKSMYLEKPKSLIIWNGGSNLDIDLISAFSKANVFIAWCVLGVFGSRLQPLSFVLGAGTCLSFVPFLSSQ
jgi:hypothetical protein